MSADVRLLGVLAAVFVASWVLGGALRRFRVPLVILPLYLGVVAGALPVHETFVQTGTLTFLSDLGLVVILFFIGLELDFGALVRLPGIGILTGASVLFPWLLGALVVWSMGYSWQIAIFVGLLTSPVAEGVVVPILDEFRLIRSRAGRYIVAVGAIDDLIEFVVIIVASVWIASSGQAGADWGGHLLAMSGFVATLFCIWKLGGRILAFVPRRGTSWSLVALSLLFLAAFLAEAAELGMALGALLAGVVLRPHLERGGEVGRQTFEGVAVVAYGLLGPMFFFEVGSNVDLWSVASQPALATGLLLAAAIGKLAAPLPLVRTSALTARESVVIGTAMSVRMSTTLAVADLLFSRHLLDGQLYSAVVASVSVSTLLVPMLLTQMVRRWGSTLRVADDTGNTEAV